MSGVFLRNGGLGGRHAGNVAFWVSGFLSGFRFQVLGFGFRGLGLCSEIRVLGCDFRFLGFGFSFSVFGSRASGFES